MRTKRFTEQRLVKVENSGHFMQEEQPEFVTKSLIEFFK
jgi:pimeloyl-ACP methyl ester carboxylesterase